MALQLRKPTTLSFFHRKLPCIYAKMLQCRTMHSFSSCFTPCSSLPLRLRRPKQSTFTRMLSIDRKNSYVAHLPISVCSRLQIQRRSTGGTTFGVNLVARRLMSGRSFSSKATKVIKSEGDSDGATLGSKMPGEARSAAHHAAKKRDKANVCNSVSGKVNAAVSRPKPSIRKSTAKTSESDKSSMGNESEHQALKDSSDNKPATKGKGKVQDVKAAVKKSQKPKTEKNDGEKAVQDNTGDEGLVMSNVKVQGTKVPAKKNQKHRSNEQDWEISTAAGAKVRGSLKALEENELGGTSTSRIMECNNSVSSGGSEIKKIGPLYPPICKSVVVVESVTKAKVIQNYLGNMYEVLPSYGHLRDLAGRSGSVRPDDDFSMVWEVPASAWTHLKSIKTALNGAEHLILASDPDREGEAIAWHITEMLQQQDALGENTTVARVVFHEITESSIKSALQAPREIDKNLVNAYLARRALDYLIGFNISPLLWRKLPGCQSAGRVQSAALALICDRETDIEKFNKNEYWTVGVEFQNSCVDSLESNSSIPSHLTHLNSQKLAQLSISSHDEALEIEKRISSSKFEVLNTKTSKIVKNPPIPYITSTLQQDSANKLHFTASYTMKLAQKLYEGIKLSDGEATGLITYMRTDGMHVSQEAAEDINSFVKERFGEKFASKIARRYFKKVKNAQEAHEAIRPTNIRRMPETLKGVLDEDSLKLYTLIWCRTMACQMESSITNMIQVDIGNTEGDMVFRSVSSRVGFSGYREAYKGRKAVADGSEDKEGEINDSVFEVLQDLKDRDSLSLVKVDLQQHYTKPPARYSEGTLVKKLEELGIGRPSTYAPIMKVLQDRKYITIRSRVLHPEFRGRMVSAFLSHHFSEVADYSFTADMEAELDNISAGDTEWKGLLKDYWSRFSKCCDLASNIEIRQVENMLEKTFDHYLFAGVDNDGRVCPSCSIGTLKFKVSRFGSGYFIGCDQYPKCRHTALTIYCEEDEDIPSEKHEKSLPPKLLGYNPGSTEKIFLKNGPYGYYVQLGEDNKGCTPKRASIAQVKDIESLSLEDALELLQYPVTLGNHPDDKLPVLLRHSKTGFSIKHRRTVAPVPKNLDPKKITLEAGLKLLSSTSAKKSGRPRGKPKLDEALWE